MKIAPLAIFVFLGSFIFFTACDQVNKEGFTGVRVIDNSYSPPVVRIYEGGMVRFFNAGNNPHNVIAVEETWGSYKEIPKNDFLDVTFEKEGLYKYLCSFHASPEGDWGMVGSVVVGDIDYEDYSNFQKADAVQSFSGELRLVPREYETIQDAVNSSNPGDMILVSPGIYYEEVIVNVPSLTIRGVDRNKTIVDGEFERANGFLVAGVDGVAIENITARNALLNGFYWATVEGYRGSYLTAYNNGDYGIYAFDAVDGVLEHSYASGSPDAGFYIGQCYPCDAVINNVISENNGLGYSGTNSGGNLYIINSIFRNNKGGIAPNTLDSELLPPERESYIIGNLIENNNNLEAPAWDAQYISLGNGVVIAGGNNNYVKNNVIANHDVFGLVISAALDDNYWPAHGNTIDENLIINSGKADIAVTGISNLGNCFKKNQFDTSIPPGIQLLNNCNFNVLPMGSDLHGLWNLIARVINANTGEYAKGNWKEFDAPDPQPNMPIMQTVLNKDYKFKDFRKSIMPAVDVFEGYRNKLNDIRLPKEAYKYFDEISLH